MTNPAAIKWNIDPVSAGLTQGDAERPDLFLVVSDGEKSSPFFSEQPGPSEAHWVWHRYNQLEIPKLQEKWKNAARILGKSEDKGVRDEHRRRHFTLPARLSVVAFAGAFVISLGGLLGAGDKIEQTLDDMAASSDVTSTDDKASYLAAPTALMNRNPEGFVHEMIVIEVTP